MSSVKRLIFTFQKFTVDTYKFYRLPCYVGFLYINKIFSEAPLLVIVTILVWSSFEHQLIKHLKASR